MTYRLSLIVALTLLSEHGFAQNAGDSGYAWESSGDKSIETYSQDTSAPTTRFDPAEGAFAEKVRVSTAQTIRRFHEVLDELLAEFGYDVKMGQINGLKNISIRRVDVSEAIPRTYKRYMELLVTERIRENSKVRMVNCLPCRSKTSRLVEGKLMITSPTTNMMELNRAADQLGIDNFMDVVLVYHSTHMVLALQVFSVKDKETVWARTYNSETIRSRYQKLAIDYNQIDKARESEEYVPEYRLLFGLGGASIPNVGGTADDSGMMAISFRGTERFNNRRQEFGLLLNIWASSASLMGGGAASSATTAEEAAAEEASGEEVITPEPFGTALGLFAVYVHNLLGPLETYNKMRYGFHVGIGPLLASGYFAPALKAGGDVYFGRRWAVSPAIIYLGPSKVLVGDQFIETKGGIGGDVAISLNF